MIGGANVTINATSRRCCTTEAEGGTEGGDAVTPVVALLFSKGDAVTARIGSSPTALDAVGRGYW